MAANLTLKQGDKGIQIHFKCKNANHTAKDLSGLTITFKVWKEGRARTPLLLGNCIIEGNPADGNCYYTLTGVDFPVVDKLRFELDYTIADRVLDSSNTYYLEIYRNRVG
jgi:hypothetical protein